MTKFFGFLIVTIGISVIAFFISPSANSVLSSAIVKFSCRSGQEVKCAQWGQKLTRSTKTMILGATALGQSCERGFVEACQVSGQAWEQLAQVKRANRSFERGCHGRSSQSCLGYYLFLTRNPDYVMEARQTMELACDAGSGDRSACTYVSIVFEEEGRYDEALRIVKRMCDVHSSGPECWSAGEFYKAKGDVAGATNYYYLACKLGELRACQAHSDLFAIESQSTQAAQGQTKESLQDVMRKALLDVRKFSAFAANPGRNIEGLEAYRLKWKFYQEKLSRMRAPNQELGKAAEKFQLSLQDFNLVTQIMIRGIKTGNTASAGKVKSVMSEAYARGIQLEKVLNRYPASQARR